MAFNIKDYLNAESKKEAKPEPEVIRVSIYKLRPAGGKKNFYHTGRKEVEELARSIELVGLQQYPVVKPIDGTEEYEIIAGHKRRLALLQLVQEGKKEYEIVPCKVESAEDDIKNSLILILTNSTQRERTDFEKMQEIKEVRRLLEEWKKTREIPGRMQTIIAEILGTNKTKIGTLDKIDKRLIPELKEEFAAGRIKTATANKIASLEPEEQYELYEGFIKTGALEIKEPAVPEPEEAEPELPESLEKAIAKAEASRRGKKEEAAVEQEETQTERAADNTARSQEPEEKKMKKYKINFRGFAYVEAEDENEAIEKYEEDDVIYREERRDEIKEVGEIAIKLN